MPVPLDEYPIHQAPLSMAYFATSDPNVYDRSTLHCYERSGERQLVAGLGVHPHLGVIDAFVAFRHGARQRVIRASAALGDDRMQQMVGPIRIEVVRPLRTIRLICADAGLGLACDLTFEGAMAAADEPRPLASTGFPTVPNTQRFVQTGSWSGTIVADGAEVRVDEQTWVGARDRTWGSRPVGTGPARSRTTPATEHLHDHAGSPEGHWHIWVPLRFTDFSVIVAAEELPDGTRVLNEAVRTWPAETGRPPEQLGWPDIEIRYRPGTRHPESAVLHLMQRGRRSVTVELETRGFLPLHVGAGYGSDPSWSHGSFRGAHWVDGVGYDLADPDAEFASRIPSGVLEHVASATFTGSDGIKVAGAGVFEHQTFGRHDPSGFYSFEDVWSAD